MCSYIALPAIPARPWFAARVSFVLLSGLGTGVLTGCAADASAPPQPRPVRTMVIGDSAEREAAQIDRYDGTIVSRHEATVGFQVAGRVATRLVEVGTRVRTGTPLARLDTRDLALGVDAARAALSGAEADAVNATRDLQRTQDLHTKQVANDAALERATALAAAALARREDARSRVATAENALRYGTLSSPADGVVTAVFTEAGQVIAPGQPAFTIARDGEVEVTIDVPERRLARFSSGATARVSTLAADDSQAAPEWNAVVREIAPAADPVTGTYRVRLTLQAARPMPALGQTASVVMRHGAARGSVRIPTTALVQTSKTPGVWRLSADGRRVRFQPVTIGNVGDGLVTVRAGLSSGDEIVTAGANRLDSTLVVRRWQGGAR